MRKWSVANKSQTDADVRAGRRTDKTTTESYPNEGYSTRLNVLDAKK